MDLFLWGEGCATQVVDIAYRSVFKFIASVS